MPSKSSLYSILLVVFIDYFGIALVYPLFSSMLFDSNYLLLPSTATTASRGFYLGVLFSLMPLTQFLSSPIWGSLSDAKGRKPSLQLSLYITFSGYLLALIAVLLPNLTLLLASRILIGCGAGNVSIVQASIADNSDSENKSKNFGLYNMAAGLGFTLGPFLCGVCTPYGYSVPFLLATSLVAGNILFTRFFYKETHFKFFKSSLSWNAGFKQIKKALQMRGVRALLCCSFLNYFGWTFFFEFYSVFLILRFAFSPSDLSLFLGVSGAMYALSSGVLIRPLMNRYKPHTLFLLGLLGTGIAIMLIPFIHSTPLLWIDMCAVCYCTSLTCPSVSTILSNSVSSQAQGEILGVNSSINSLALIIGPLFSGSFVGRYPTSPMWTGGATMLLACLIYFMAITKHRRR